MDQNRYSLALAPVGEVCDTGQVTFFPHSFNLLLRKVRELHGLRSLLVS